MHHGDTVMCIPTRFNPREGPVKAGMRFLHAELHFVRSDAG